LTDIEKITERALKEVYFWVKRNLFQLEQENQLKVLLAFQKNKVEDYHFNPSTGYGYDDQGREVLDNVFADVFRAEQAMVRSQWVSGTHVITTVLESILRPGDELLYIGKPYPTLKPVIKGTKSSLDSWKISFDEVNWSDDLEELISNTKSKIKPHTRVVAIQRSCGYSWRRGLTIREIRKIIEEIKRVKISLIVFVDNCYGEFTEKEEPLEVGADIIAGSLIKNPGGGLAPYGGYVAGKQEIVELVANRFSAPGLGNKVGANAEGYRLYFQGLFLAPHFVIEALKTGIFAASVFSSLGFDVLPQSNAPRGDIVQAIALKDKDNLQLFVDTIQTFSPINAHYHPVPLPLAGYEGEEVIMAGGTFIQGASLELSADAPFRPPYIAYLQGGLSFVHSYQTLKKVANTLCSF